MGRIQKLTIFLSILYAVVGFASSAYGADEPMRTFSEGVYRQDGACNRFTRFTKDEIDKCEPYLGVSVRSDDRPEFMFPLKSGQSRVFVAAKGAQFSDGNRVISYALSRVVDLESGMQYDVFGDCILRILAEREEIHCASWTDQERKQSAFEAVFVGSGMWLHKPSFAKKP
jgi:hypothetical protein